MSILGIGTDIVEIARFEKESLSPAFFERVFTPAEIAYCRARARPAQHFAARFAAKEATVKALAWPTSPPTITQVEVLKHEVTGAPSLRLVTGRYGSPPPALTDGVRLYVSLSHGKEHAVATVVAEDTS